MNEQGCHQDNARGFDGSNITLLYTVILYFDSAPIVLSFVIPTNPVNISFFSVNEQLHQDNGRGFDGNNIPPLYTVLLHFEIATIVLLFLIPTNPVNISFQ